ncbi:MAG: DUF4350 domain-containing protein [Chitinophagaceae bacterium]|nr:MAG: DUF4350 domain-containing protein [Chitinophagaceae bacterium]
MKKSVPYLLLGLIVAAVIFLFVTGNNTADRVLDERLTFRKRDKIPYGTFVAYENLKEIFPKAAVSSDRRMPGDWDSLSLYGKRQALLIVSPFFNAEDEEMKSLLEFIKRGNDVFVSTMKVSYPVEKMVKCDIYYPVDFNGEIKINEKDSLRVGLDIPVARRPQWFAYPGKRYDFRFYEYDTLTTTVLGYDAGSDPNFIKLSAGKGHFFLHLAPMAFTNYFLLYKNNMEYYEKALSVISPNTTKVVWDEYFLAKGRENNQDKKSNWLSVFLRYPGLRWGLITALLALLTYVLLEMRRKQRPIPVINKPKNDSLDFVKTIGRLYHDKGDHTNLCRKMAAYFLEHVRTRYKLPTSELNDEFIQNLRFKTGMEEEPIREIVSFINHLNVAGAATDKELVLFHKQLESFYKIA